MDDYINNLKLEDLHNINENHYPITKLFTNNNRIINNKIISYTVNRYDYFINGINNIVIKNHKNKIKEIKLFIGNTLINTLVIKNKRSVLNLKLLNKNGFKNNKDITNYIGSFISGIDGTLDHQLEINPFYVNIYDLINYPYIPILKFHNIEIIIDFNDDLNIDDVIIEYNLIKYNQKLEFNLLYCENIYYYNINYNNITPYVDKHTKIIAIKSSLKVRELFIKLNNDIFYFTKDYSDDFIYWYLDFHKIIDVPINEILIQSNIIDFEYDMTIKCINQLHFIYGMVKKYSNFNENTI